MEMAGTLGATEGALAAAARPYSWSRYITDAEWAPDDHRAELITALGPCFESPAGWALLRDGCYQARRSAALPAEPAAAASCPLPHADAPRPRAPHSPP